MAPLVDEGLLYLMKDQDGNFCSPAYNFNNIDRWHGVQGYQLRTDRAEFTIEGEVIPWNTAIDLREGWEMVPVYDWIEIDPDIDGNDFDINSFL